MDNESNMEIVKSNCNLPVVTELEEYSVDEPIVEILTISPDKNIIKDEISLFLSTDEKYLQSYCDRNKSNFNYSRWTVPQPFAVNTYEEFEEILKNYEHETFSWFIKAVKYKSKTQKYNKLTVHDVFCSKCRFNVVYLSS